MEIDLNCVSNFEFANGDEAIILKSSDGSMTLVANTKNDMMIITGNVFMKHVMFFYRYMFNVYGVNDKHVHIIHLGTGMGYDLLYADKAAAYSQTLSCKLTGVDNTEFGAMRVATSSFRNPVEFISLDATSYLESVNPNNFRSNSSEDNCVVLFVDLFCSTSMIPIDSVYSQDFWDLIHDKVRPDLICINIGHGSSVRKLIENTFACEQIDHDFQEANFTIETYNILEAK